jgi:hypothetical protein
MVVKVLKKGAALQQQGEQNLAHFGTLALLPV